MGFYFQRGSTFSVAPVHYPQQEVGLSKIAPCAQKRKENPDRTLQKI
jgi:hypothetical protein